MTAANTICRCNACNGEIEFEPTHAGETITCPWCAQETELYIPGGLVRVEKVSPPPPPPLSAPSPAVIVMSPPRQREATFGSVFKIVFYVCASLILLVVLAFVGIAFLGGIFSAVQESPARTEATAPTPTAKRTVDASIKVNHRSLFVKNDNDFTWAPPKIFLNGIVTGYRYQHKSSVEPGATIMIPLTAFTKRSGERFQGDRYQPTEAIVSVDGCDSPVYGFK